MILSWIWWFREKLPAASAIDDDHQPHLTERMNSVVLCPFCFHRVDMGVEMKEEKEVLLFSAV